LGPGIDEMRAEASSYLVGWWVSRISRRRQQWRAKQRRVGLWGRAFNAALPRQGLAWRRATVVASAAVVAVHYGTDEDRVEYAHTARCLATRPKNNPVIMSLFFIEKNSLSCPAFAWNYLFNSVVPTSCQDKSIFTKECCFDFLGIMFDRSVYLILMYIVKQMSYNKINSICKNQTVFIIGRYEIYFFRIF
jgi:hypothetical protein